MQRKKTSDYRCVRKLINASTGKEDQKLVPIKREEIVTGTENISPPNHRRDESSVDMDKYVGVFVTRDIEPVLNIIPHK